MINLITILAILFLALFVIVSVLERYGSRESSESINKLSRFIIPLIALMLILQAIRYFVLNQ